MRAKAIMLQGTGSDVGKSILVAGLCRAFRNRGLNVLPFKPQNMSNNAAVTMDGGEIGRAQELQARACGVLSSVHMNPVLLKPQSDIGAQVIVQGTVLGTTQAREYQDWKSKLLAAVLESFEHLARHADLIIVEGAGSASEINLRSNDIANMGFARAADVPVILVGDIDRGGVIAQIIGTKTVIDPDDAAMIAGFIVNKFRGDPSLFTEGMNMISARSGWLPIGLVPFFKDVDRLPAEDAMALTQKWKSGTGRVTVAVPILPRIANFDDLDPLKQEPDIRLVMVRNGEPLPADADLVLLPGSKSTIADLQDFRRAGWDIDLHAHVRRGGHVLGICGGYQMLGQKIADPEGIEGPPGACEGLGLLDVTTVLTGRKTLKNVAGTTDKGLPFRGYEMHMGETTGPDRQKPMAFFADGRSDGAISPNGRVKGCYIHGYFSQDQLRQSWLEELGGHASDQDYEQGVEATLDALATHLESCLDIDRILMLAR